MALTEKQDIPTRKPAENEGWTFRRLFPMRATASTISKMFVSPLEILLGWVVFIIGLAVLFGRPVTPLCYLLALGLLAAVTYESTIITKTPPPTEVKKPK